MRVLLINQFYIPDTAATGQLLADVAESLVLEGHEVHVICSRRSYNGRHERLAKTETIHGVHIHRVTTMGFGRRWLVGRTLDDLAFYLGGALGAVFLRRADLCVSLTTPPFVSLIGLLLSKLKGTRNVIWVMDVYPEIAVAYKVFSKRSLMYRLLSRMNRALYRDAAAVISPGEVMTQRLQALGVPNDRLHTVHNWVPGEKISARPLQVN